MPAPATTAELLELVAKSGLVDDVRYRALFATFTESQSLSPDPRDVACSLVGSGLLTWFQAKQLSLGRWKGFNIGQYRLLELVGANTTGASYLCECSRMQRIVVAEVLPTELAAAPGSLDRFYRQARAMASCDHEKVVRAYDINQDANLHFIVMEYVDGVRLLDLIKRGPLDPVRIAHYIAQAAEGLQHIHDQGLVHRNVKPRELLLDRKGRVKVSGMNIVLFRNHPPTDDMIRGTPNYIAPEQALDSASVDHRADVYALGCTAYHLLTGQPPFPKGSAAQKLIWHQTRDPQPIRSLRPAVPEELARVVERMMAKRVEARYQSAAEVVAALEPWCRTPIPPPPAEELPQHCPRVREILER